MEKYDKNKDIKPDTLIQTLASVGRVILMLIGIVGIAVGLFQDDGWLKQSLNKMADSSLGLGWIAVIIVLLFILSRWMNSPSGKANARGNLPMYLMMLIGAFFLFRLVTTGSF